MADNKNDQINTEEDISELLKIRRDKLDSLKKEGNDPFEITVSNRDSYAQKVNMMRVQPTTGWLQILHTSFFLI